jgi:hypothetical protein
MVLISRRMREAGNVPEEYLDLVGKPEGKRQLVRPRSR